MNILIIIFFGIMYYIKINYLNPNYINIIMLNGCGVIIIQKNATLKPYYIKNYKEEELYKKCSFKNNEGFNKQVEWKVKLEKETYLISMYGKLEGKANMENKYEFPPPIDNKLFFGSCLLVCRIQKIKEINLISLTLSLWEKIYEKLFGGFEDLNALVNEDETEEDELDLIPKTMKTKKGGYLKDGFVIDSDDEENESIYESEDEPIFNYSKKAKKEMIEQEEIEIEDIRSEISEESYEYTDTD